LFSTLFGFGLLHPASRVMNSNVCLGLSWFRKLFTSTETTSPPKGHLSSWCRAAAVITGGHSVHINPAGMARPDTGFTFWLGGLFGVMLLNTQILYFMARCTQSCQELVAVVEEGLSPLRMTGANNQNPLPHAQWSAMGGKLRAC
jgi:hypothetical protein|tara:strand:- start:163 stop:597 length:435 start_codon:yes stop_codon:yes gene_type:complete